MLSADAPNNSHAGQKLQGGGNKWSGNRQRNSQKPKKPSAKSSASHKNHPQFAQTAENEAAVENTLQKFAELNVSDASLASSTAVSSVSALQSDLCDYLYDKAFLSGYPYSHIFQLADQNN
jgi:hypothetical protein